MIDAQLPKVSILLPIFNSAKTIERAIESVLSQTYSNWELIISDNSSEDSSWEIAQKYASSEPRIRCYRNDINVGSLANYNFCISKAQGEFLELFGSDDAFAPECIETLVTGLIKYPNAVIATCAKKFLRDDFSVQQISRPHEGTVCIPGIKVIEAFLLSLSNPYSSPMMFHSKLKGQGFSNEFLLYSDVDYWCSMLLKGDLLYIDEDLFSYSMRTDSQTMSFISDMSFGVDLVAFWDKYSYILEPNDDLHEVMEARISESGRAILEYSMDKNPNCFEWVFDSSSRRKFVSSINFNSASEERMIVNLFRLAYFGFNYSNRLFKSTKVLESQLSLQQERNRGLENELAKLQSQLDDTLRTTSWKITRPLRRAVGLLKRIGLF